jgi:hypothetical protein
MAIPPLEPFVLRSESRYQGTSRPQLFEISLNHSTVRNAAGESPFMAFRNNVAQSALKTVRPSLQNESYLHTAGADCLITHQSWR